MAAKKHRTTGNVFADIGFAHDQAEHLKVRAMLMTELTRLIRSRGLTQCHAARLLGVSQPRVSDLTRGKIDRFSIDTLVEMLGNAGAQVSLKVQRRSRIA